MNSQIVTRPAGKTLETIRRVTWAAFLVCLPVTSFPFFPPALGGGALVRPLSIYPLILLVLLFTIPYLLRKPLPKTVLVLFPFILVALLSSLLSTLRDIDPALGISIVERVLRTLITLGIGAAIYLTVTLLPRSLDELRLSLRWLYAGFAVALLWGSLQAFYIIHFVPGYFRLLQDIQRFISIRRLFNTRVSGMTYEPNWFAEQISFLLLPWLLSSVLSGYSVFRWRWRWLTLEWLLLVWSVLILAFTFSRAGVLNLLVLSFVGFLFFRSRRGAVSHIKKTSALRSWSIRLAEALLVLSIVVSVVYFAGTRSEFFARIWSYWTEKQNPTLSGYIEYLGFGARFAYGETALAVYADYPVLGVGLGNFAYYFEQKLPDRQLADTPEILRLLTPDAGRDRLITPKNFFNRLLAETGLVGAAAFTVFLVALLGCALFLWLSPETEQKFWGAASFLGLLGFVFSALSFDSFAIPNMWVVFGLTTAAARLLNPPVSAPDPRVVYPQPSRSQTEIS